MSSISSHHNRYSSNPDSRVTPTPNAPYGSRPRVHSQQVGGSRGSPSSQLPLNGHTARRSVERTSLGLAWDAERAGGSNVLSSESRTIQTTVRTRSPVKDRDAGYGYASKKSRELQRPSSGHSGSTPKPAAPPRRTVEVPQAPWEPRACLKPHTSAPLASRVSAPPLIAQAPPQLQPPALNQQPLEVQEAAILEDLMFVLMGLEGHYIRFRESYNPEQEKDRLAGPGFRMVHGLDHSIRDLTATMLRMATHYVAVDAFVEVHSQDEYGAVNHALCASIRKYLEEYLELVAELEHQLLTDPTLTLHLLHLRTLPVSHNFAHLYALCQEIIRKDQQLESNLDDDFEDFDKMIELLQEGANLAPGSDPPKRRCKGGGVLGLLTHRLSSMSGDPSARALLTGLLQDASRPYMAMLNEWLHHGGIRDPHAEFLIKEQQNIHRDRLEQDYTDEYWEKRYTVRVRDVPPQLEGVKEKVLLAGKYLNVVRECGGVDINDASNPPETFDDPRFLDNVNDAYAYANSSLLNLLLTTHALPARLRSMKHYFFLDRSDFFTHFLDLALSELRKPVRAVNVGKLQSLLDLVLRQPGSVAALDPYKEDVKIQLNEIGLTSWLMRVVSVSGIDQESGDFSSIRAEHREMSLAPSYEEDNKDTRSSTGYHALELDYVVPFPLSLVIGRKTVLRYQLMFRYLLSLRHLESLLMSSWSEQTKARNWRHQSSDPRFEVWKRRAWTLRSRMLVFVQQLLYYCTAQVIEPNWRTLMASLGEAGQIQTGGGFNVPSSPPPRMVPKQPSRTVDELMQDHVDFLDTCLKECMLTNEKLLKIHAKIMNTCTLFATYIPHLTRSIITADAGLCSSSSSSEQHQQQSSSTTTATAPASTTQPHSENQSSSRPSSSSTSGHQTVNPQTHTTTTSHHPNNTNNTNNKPLPPQQHQQQKHQYQYNPSRVNKLSDNLKIYEENFNHTLKILLKALNYYAASETTALNNLCARLSMAREGMMVPTEGVRGGGPFGDADGVGVGDGGDGVGDDRGGAGGGLDGANDDPDEDDFRERAGGGSGGWNGNGRERERERGRGVNASTNATTGMDWS